MTIILIYDVKVGPCPLLSVVFGLPLNPRLGCFLSSIIPPPPPHPDLLGLQLMGLDRNDTCRSL